jgi:hypothetical protein
LRTFKSHHATNHLFLQHQHLSVSIAHNHRTSTALPTPLPPRITTLVEPLELSLHRRGCSARHKEPDTYTFDTAIKHPYNHIDNPRASFLSFHSRRHAYHRLHRRAASSCFREQPVQHRQLADQIDRPKAGTQSATHRGHRSDFSCRPSRS